MKTIPDIVKYHGATAPDRIAWVFEGRQTTFAQARDNVRRLADALSGNVLAAGDRIACLAKNSERYLELLLAAGAAGLTLVPLNWRLSIEELAFIISDCEARLLFADTEHMGVAEALSATVIPLEGDGLEEWLDKSPQGKPKPATSDDVALQLYTSGTTGRPKGVMLTHRAIMEPRKHWLELDWYRWNPDDVELNAMPFFHVGGLAWALMSMYAGNPTVILREFDPKAVLNAIETERVTKTFLVPSALQIVIRHADVSRHDLSSLRMILYGASPMPIELLRESMDTLGCEFTQTYGMTETFGVIAILEPKDHDAASESPVMRSAGKALPGVDIEIRRADGKRLEAHQVGEIMIRSDSRMTGYWRLPEATAEAMDDAGWFASGDAGFMDEAGYLYVHDRLKDMIISGGENIYAAEVENAIFGHPDIAEVAVIGLPDERWGEAVCAIVVAAPSKSPSHQDVAEWTRSKIASYKVPKKLILVDELPRNGSGKVLRRELRLMFAPQQ